MNVMKLTEEELKQAKAMSRKELMELADKDLRYRSDVLWEAFYNLYFPEKSITAL